MLPHFQVVFTLPKPLWSVARRFPKEVFGILLKAAAQPLTDVAAYRWDALPTVLSVLHTWNRKMDFYPHVHCIVSAGGLRQDGSWYAHGTDFLFPTSTASRHSAVEPEAFRGLPRVQASGRPPSWAWNHLLRPPFSRC